MAGTTELPTWAVYAVSLGTPTSAFTGVMLTGWLGRRTATEQETRSRREEVMRLLRWAAELAVSDDDRRAALGVDQLTALSVSSLLDDPEKALVDAALESALDSSAEEIKAIESSGEPVEVVLLAPSTYDDPDVPSNSAAEEAKDG